MESNINYKKQSQLTGESVNAVSQALHGVNVDKLTARQAYVVYEELTSMVYKTQFLELQNAIPQIKQFFVEETKFGEGFRQIMVDILKVSDFTKESWWPSNAVTAEAREVFVKELIEVNVRGDKSEFDLLQKFKDANELATFINMQSEAANKAMAVFYQQLIWNILQTDENFTWSVLSIRDASGVEDNTATQEWINKMNAVVKMVRQGLRKKKNVEYEILSTDFRNEKYYMNKAMITSIMTDIALVTEKVRKDNAAGDAGDGKVYDHNGNLIDAYPFHSKPDLSQLTLVINQKTLISMNVDIRATTFNSDMLKLPEVKTLQISSLSENTYKLIDDRLFQISPNIREFGVFPRNIYTLVVLSNYIEKSYVGFNPYLFGIEVTMVPKVVEKLKEPSEIEKMAEQVLKNQLSIEKALLSIEKLAKK